MPQFDEDEWRRTGSGVAQLLPGGHEMAHFAGIPENPALMREKRHSTSREAGMQDTHAFGYALRRR